MKKTEERNYFFHSRLFLALGRLQLPLHGAKIAPCLCLDYFRLFYLKKKPLLVATAMNNRKNI
jgi:hypothetical protein